MRIFGSYVRASAVAASGGNATDRTRVDYYTAPDDGYIAKLTSYYDGNGGSVGVAKIRAVVYDAAFALRGVGSEASVASGAAGAWVDTSFVTPVAMKKGETIRIGHQFGGDAGVARGWVIDPNGLGGGSQTVDAYSDGPASPLVVDATTTSQKILFATFVKDWSLPPNVDDFYIARLPWVESQRILGEGGPLPTSAVYANVGWHGTELDDELGSFAIVKEGSIYEALIGERIRITRADVTRRQETSAGRVFAFVHNRYGLVDDISLPRRMFLGLGYPASDNFRCLVEVMTT